MRVAPRLLNSAVRYSKLGFDKSFKIYIQASINAHNAYSITLYAYSPLNG